MVEVLEVCKYFISKSSLGTTRPISHLKLQKLVYYAQAWNLALHDEPLFPDRIEAWVHGPVCPKVYYEYRRFGFRDLEYDGDVELDDNTKEFLDAVLKVYGKFDAKSLEELTHRETPWITARRGAPRTAYSNMVIGHKTMREFYKSLLNK